MRPFHLGIVVCLAACAAACTVQDKNNDDVRLSVPVLTPQVWQVSQQESTPSGRVCTVSAGEMDVAQWAESGRLRQQVAINYKIYPGDSYKVLLPGPHNYETLDGRFTPAESARIVHDMMSAPVIYTELSSRIVSDRGGQWKRWPNKIPLGNFPQLYRKCTTFVKGR